MKWTEQDVSIAKGMLARGDNQMHIAVWFGCNQARISEINKGRSTFGKRWRHVLPCSPDLLPPPGPYAIVSKVVHDDQTAKAQAYDELVKSLEQWLFSHRPKHTEKLSTASI